MKNIDISMQSHFSKLQSIELNNPNHIQTMAIQRIKNLPPNGLTLIEHIIEQCNTIHAFTLETTETPPVSENIISNQSNFCITLQDQQIIEINNCSQFIIRTNSQNINNTTIIKISNSCDFFIQNIVFDTTTDSITISNCQNFTISACNFQNCLGYGITVLNGQQFVIQNNNFNQQNKSSIYIVGHSERGLITQNTIKNSTGLLNSDAGIHLNHCSSMINDENVTVNSHEPLSITEKTLIPKYIDINHNNITGGLSQGIYFEGATYCLVHSNTIVGNNKEGICFDWGSALNLFYANSVSANGQRANMTPEMLKIDFIEHIPTLSDHSSASKLPGVSIDNGVFNFFIKNDITQNYGGGIKCVRSSFYNIFSENTLVSNGLGINHFMSYFHEIVFSFAPAGNEFVGQPLLDIHPCNFNYILSNQYKPSFGLYNIYQTLESNQNHILSQGEWI